MIDLYNNYPALKNCKDEIEKSLSIMIDTYKNNGKILVCGNGGSCADSDHIVGELMKGFLLKRKPEKIKEKLDALGFDDSEFIAQNLQGALSAISLTSQSAIISAFANDVSPDMVYAQLVYGYAHKNDLFIGLSTSGNSKNIVYAAKVAKMMGAKTLAFTGKNKSMLSDICDVTIQVPETETYRVQELHLPVYHYLRAMTEKEFFNN